MKPDYLAVVDVDPHSKTYSRVDPAAGRCRTSATSCITSAGMRAAVATASLAQRRYLVCPGWAPAAFTSSTCRPAPPRLHKVIEPEEIIAEDEPLRPAHGALPGRRAIMISMLGDAKGDGPGGFLLLDENFDIAGRWEASREGMNFNYDFWYQPRHNVMVSSEWAAPNTVRPGL
jgi:methanethiol oxidase